LVQGDLKNRRKK